MYPSRFRYEAPRSLDEALALLRQFGDEAKVLAGGQSLIPLLKLRFAAPGLLVDINGIPGLDHHREDPDGTLHVGALCRHVTLERSALLAAKHPLMASAAPMIWEAPAREKASKEQNQDVVARWVVLTVAPAEAGRGAQLSLPLALHSA